MSQLLFNKVLKLKNNNIRIKSSSSKTFLPSSPSSFVFLKILFYSCVISCTNIPYTSSTSDFHYVPSANFRRVPDPRLPQTQAQSQPQQFFHQNQSPRLGSIPYTSQYQHPHQIKNQPYTNQPPPPPPPPPLSISTSSQPLLQEEISALEKRAQDLRAEYIKSLFSKPSIDPVEEQLRRRRLDLATRPREARRGLVEDLDLDLDLDWKPTPVLPFVNSVNNKSPGITNGFSTHKTSSSLFNDNQSIKGTNTRKPSPFIGSPYQPQDNYIEKNSKNLPTTPGSIPNKANREINGWKGLLGPTVQPKNFTKKYNKKPTTIPTINKTKSSSLQNHKKYTTLERNIEKDKKQHKASLNIQKLLNIKPQNSKKSDVIPGYAKVLTSTPSTFKSNNSKDPSIISSSSKISTKIISSKLDKTLKGKGHSVQPKIGINKSSSHVNIYKKTPSKSSSKPNNNKSLPLTAAKANKKHNLTFENAFKPPPGKLTLSQSIIKSLALDNTSSTLVTRKGQNETDKVKPFEILNYLLNFNIANKSNHLSTPMSLEQAINSINFDNNPKNNIIQPELSNPSLLKIKISNKTSSSSSKVSKSSSISKSINPHHIAPTPMTINQPSTNPILSLRNPIIFNNNNNVSTTMMSMQPRSDYDTGSDETHHFNKNNNDGHQNFNYYQPQPQPHLYPRDFNQMNMLRPSSMPINPSLMPTMPQNNINIPYPRKNYYNQDDLHQHPRQPFRHPYRFIRHPHEIMVGTGRMAPKSNFFSSNNVKEQDDSEEVKDERHDLPQIVDPHHPLVQNALNPLGNPIMEPDQYIKKKTKIIDPTSLIPLNKTYVVVAMMISWILILLAVCSYHTLIKKGGVGGGGMGGGGNGHHHGGPLEKLGQKPFPQFNIPQDGSNPFFSSRALDTSPGSPWNFTKVLEYIDIAQKAYEGFDWQNLDCQKRILCELSQKDTFGETGRAITDNYFLRYVDLLDGVPIPKVIQNYLTEYKEAITQGKNSNKDCGLVYGKCKFSIKEVMASAGKKKKN